jgi:hypothetical protein
MTLWIRIPDPDPGVIYRRNFFFFNLVLFNEFLFIFVAKKILVKTTGTLQKYLPKSIFEC